MRKKHRFIMDKKDINLLPEGLKKELRLNMQIGKFIILFVIIYIFTLITFSTFLYMNRKLETKYIIFTEMLDSEKYNDAEKVHSEIERLRAEITRIDSLISEIKNPRFISAYNFRYIYDLLPDGIYAQTVSMRTEREITFSGITAEREKISDFIDALYNTGNYESISLKSLMASENGKIYFTISFYTSEYNLIQSGTGLNMEKDTP